MSRCAKFIIIIFLILFSEFLTANLRAMLPTDFTFHTLFPWDCISMVYIFCFSKSRKIFNYSIWIYLQATSGCGCGHLIIIGCGIYLMLDFFFFFFLSKKKYLLRWLPKLSIHCSRHNRAAGTTLGLLTVCVRLHILTFTHKDCVVLLRLLLRGRIVCGSHLRLLPRELVAEITAAASKNKRTTGSPKCDCVWLKILLIECVNFTYFQFRPFAT